MTMIDVDGSYSAEADKRDGAGLLDIYRAALIANANVCQYAPDLQYGGFHVFVRGGDRAWFDTTADTLDEVYAIAKDWDVPRELCFEVKDAWWR